MFLGNFFSVTVSADAYFPSEKVTEEQNESYKSFLENSTSIINNAENILVAEAGSKELAIERFIPKMIKIKRNGDYAFLFDDKSDFENGIVVSIKPKLEIMSTDEYL